MNAQVQGEARQGSDKRTSETSVSVARIGTNFSQYWRWSRRERQMASSGTSKRPFELSMGAYSKLPRTLKTETCRDRVKFGSLFGSSGTNQWKIRLETQWRDARGKTWLIAPLANFTHTVRELFKDLGHSRAVNLFLFCILKQSLFILTRTLFKFQLKPELVRPTNPARWLLLCTSSPLVTHSLPTKKYTTRPLIFLRKVQRKQFKKMLN